MKGNLKRVFQAMFLVLATVMLLSIPASAASSKTVATIGKKPYTSLEAAVKKVKKGQTIKLKKNVKLSSYTPLTLNRNVKYTINLNGYKITGKNSNRGTIYVKKGTVTFKNGTVDCWIKVYKNASLTTSSIKMPVKNDAYVYVQKKGKLTIKSGTYYDIINYGTLSIKNGTFKYNNPSGKIQNYGTMTIAEGTFKGSIENNGKATISGGTFNLTDLGFGNFTGATMKISGGTFNSESLLSDVIKNSGTMTISGGKINMKCGVQNGEGGTLTISGGTITNSSTEGSVITSAVENFGTFKMTGGTLKVSSSLGYALDNFGSATISGGTLTSKQVYKVRNNGSLSYNKSVLSKGQIDDWTSN